jgi:hypothetical protein
MAFINGEQEMSKVHVLPGAQKPGPDRDVLALLEKLLEKAKDGKVIFVAVTHFDEEDDVHHDYAGEASAYEMIGAVEDLKQTIREEQLG